jgi:hypothetical protein
MNCVIKRSTTIQPLFISILTFIRKYKKNFYFINYCLILYCIFPFKDLNKPNDNENISSGKAEIK